MSTTLTARRGVIDRYRSWLPVTEATPVITLGEGSTPLVPAHVLSEELGCEVWLKVEGANPTGSFKDRGMTVAVSVSAGEGAEAVVCASTGNTSASAAAYASRGGLKPIVLLPAGRIAAGKLAQAIVHGAQVVQVEGNFDDCLRLARSLAEAIPWLWSTRSTRSGSKGRRPPRSRSSTTSATPRTCTCSRSGTAATSPRTGVATSSTPKPVSPVTAPGCGPSRPPGAAPLVLGHPVPNPETVATAIRIGDPASTTLAVAAKEESGGRFGAVTDEEILAAQGFLAAREGVFVEPASAAGVAGLRGLAQRGEVDRGQRIVVTVTGHGLKDIDTALSGRTVQAEVVAAELTKVAQACGLAG